VILKEQILLIAKQRFSYNYPLVELALKTMSGSAELEKLSLLMFKAKNDDELEVGLEEIFKK